MGGGREPYNSRTVVSWHPTQSTASPSSLWMVPPASLPLLLHGATHGQGVKNAVGARQLLTPVLKLSGRARHSWSIPKHSRGLINVPYGVAAAVRATPDFEICQHFKSGKTLLEARLTGSFKVKVVPPLLCHVGLSALPVFWSQVHSSL